MCSCCDSHEQTPEKSVGRSSHACNMGEEPYVDTPSQKENSVQNAIYRETKPQESACLGLQGEGS